MRILSRVTAIFLIYLFICDNLYQAGMRAFKRNDPYNGVRYLFAASVLNPASITFSQEEKRIGITGTAGKRMIMFHPNDYDAIMMREMELRTTGRYQEASRMLYRAARADPYASLENNSEAAEIIKQLKSVNK